ncbi:MAG: DUF5057 domain-containing protein [Clostridiales bacterium]|nr:DUF5057 domain-containing protein [Clostridiales bacterium]
MEISPDSNAVDGIAYIGDGFYWHPFTRCYYSTDTGNSDTNNLILNVRISRQIIYLSYIPPFIFYCGGRIKTADCTLYRNGTTVSSRNISGSNAVSFDLSGYNSGDKFYCDIKVNSAYSTFGSVKSGYTNDPKGRTVSYTLYKGPNPAYVDANSNLYDLLGTICTKKNVKSWSAVSNSDLNKNLLKRYVNLPKPDIVFSKNANGSYVKYPTVYSIENGKMNSLIRTEGVNRLEYVFKIQNAADPLPQNTRYTCNLYIDMDGNGSFSENEIINDAGIREWKNASPGVRVANGNLSADKEYYLFYELPDSKVGLVPWKISIADNVYMAYDDEVNYTRVLPLAVEPVKTVEILQIAPDAGTINLQEQTAEAASGGYPSSVTGKSYRGIIGKLLADVSEDIKVRVTTVSASTVNNVSSRNPLSHTFIDKDGNIKTVQYSDPGLYLASFDMLVLGFGDSYGELSTDTVKAVSKFIDSNRPVLMTHDTTSFYSLPRADFRVRYGNVYVYGSKDAKINGYSVNMLLRGKIGMDRYGVADPVYGYTSYIPDEITKRTPKRPGPVADSYSGADVSGIKNAGYDIAYKAKSLGNADSISSLKGKTVPETQGLTTGVLARFLLSGKMPFKNARFSTNDTNDKAGFTTTVSQLNKGQITTYPYDVNTALFKGVGSDNSMTVADTHFQYYQLNMNPDDMVVWYCLEDDTSGKYPDSNIYAKNDAANSYYIYTCGNITYSGMGHSKDINETEAKLFVNTLIAAYRTGESAPTVSFSNKDGTKKGIDSFFIPCDGDSILVPAGGGDESRRIYFTVNDSNISQSKIIKAAFRCGNSGTELSLSVYDAETDKAVSTLTSTYTYYVKLDELLTELNKQGISIGSGGLNFSVTVTSELPSGNKKTGSAVISLRKLALFPLS